MGIEPALVGQYRAGLEMLKQCIAICPDDLWAAGTHPRTFWRIAYHALFYTHLYLMPEEAAFEPWPGHQSHARILWDDDEEGIPPVETTYTQAELLEYADHISNRVEDWVGAVDLASPHSGFSWYAIPKLDHQIVNIRHLGIHVGQLQELLYARGLEPGWVGRV